MDELRIQIQHYIYRLLEERSKHGKVSRGKTEKNM